MRSFAVFRLSPLVGGRRSAPESGIKNQDSKFRLKLVHSEESPRQIDGEPLPRIRLMGRTRRLERVA